MAYQSALFFVTVSIHHVVQSIGSVGELPSEARRLEKRSSIEHSLVLVHADGAMGKDHRGESMRSSKHKRLVRSASEGLKPKTRRRQGKRGNASVRNTTDAEGLLESQKQRQLDPYYDYFSSFVTDNESLEECRAVGNQREAEAALMKTLAEDGLRYGRYMLHGYAVKAMLAFICSIIVGVGLSALASHLLWTYRKELGLTKKSEAFSGYFKEHYWLGALLRHPNLFLLSVALVLMIIMATVVYVAVNSLMEYAERIDQGLVNRAVMQLERSFVREMAMGNAGDLSTLTLDIINPFDGDVILKAVSGQFFLQDSMVLLFWLGDGNNTLVDEAVLPPRKEASFTVGTELTEFNGAMGAVSALKDNYAGKDVWLKLTANFAGEAISRDFEAHAEVRLPVKLSCLVPPEFDGRKYDGAWFLQAAYIGMRNAHATTDEHVLINHEKTVVTGSLVSPIYTTLVCISLALVLMSVILAFSLHALYLHLKEKHRGHGKQEKEERASINSGNSGSSAGSGQIAIDGTRAAPQPADYDPFKAGALRPQLGAPGAQTGQAAQWGNPAAQPQFGAASVAQWGLGGAAPGLQWGQPGTAPLAPQPGAAPPAPQWGQPGAAPPAPQWGQPGAAAPAPQWGQPGAAAPAPQWGQPGAAPPTQQWGQPGAAQPPVQPQWNAGAQQFGAAPVPGSSPQPQTVGAGAQLGQPVQPLGQPGFLPPPAGQSPGQQPWGQPGGQPGQPWGQPGSAPIGQAQGPLGQPLQPGQPLAQPNAQRWPAAPTQGQPLQPSHAPPLNFTPSPGSRE